MEGGADPVEVFLEVLRRYLRDRGRMIVSMAEAAGQTRLRVSLRGLWRRYEAGSTEYYWFMDVVEAIRGCSECLQRLREEAGVLEFGEEEGEPYMVVEVRMLKKLLEEATG